MAIKMKKMTLNVSSQYEGLVPILQEAINRLQSGKGRERHAVNTSHLPIAQQSMANVRREVGPGFTLGQVAKKAQEAAGMDEDARVKECLDIINYAAVEVLVSKEPGAA